MFLGRLRELGFAVVDAFLVATVIGLFLRTWLLATVVVESRSMAPTLLPGDRLLVNRFVFAGGSAPPRWLPQRSPLEGDLTELRAGSVDLLGAAGNPEQRSLLKRCVARGPATVALRDKRLLVDQTTLSEPYARWEDDHIYPDSALLEPPLRGRDNFPPRDLAAGELFLLGDNRDYSFDSRFFGQVSTTAVRGRPLLRLWQARGAREADAQGPTWVR